MEQPNKIRDEAKVEHLEEEDISAGADFGGGTLAIIHSDAETSPYFSTVEEKLATENALLSTNTETNKADGDQTPVETPTTFFAARSGAFENAISACLPIILPCIDGEMLGSWLLTEIDHWDAEKERLVLLTKCSLLIVKYDFIALKVLDYKRVSLTEFDKVIVGKFSYPETSVVPRHRSTKGLRAMWNKGERIDVKESWNPWSRSIPYVTLTSHPYASLNVDEEGAVSFDIDNFSEIFINTIKNLIETGTSSCVIEEQPIMIESYLGLVSMFHNINNLGFFKLRGKVSF